VSAKPGPAIWNRVWLPIDVKDCENCTYKKHPSSTYDADGKWPHWCPAPEPNAERDAWKARALKAEAALEALRKILRS
jgi:hypothetical protein